MPAGRREEEKGEGRGGRNVRGEEGKGEGRGGRNVRGDPEKRGRERRQRCERGGGKREGERVEGQLIYKGKGGQIEEKNHS